PSTKCLVVGKKPRRHILLTAERLIRSISRDSNTRKKSRTMILKQRSILPGFGLSMGFTLMYLSLIVLIPIAALLLRTTSLSWAEFWSTVTAPRVLPSYQLSFATSFILAFG